MTAEHKASLLARWLHLGLMVKDRKLTASAIRVGWAILNHINRDTGKGWPSYERLEKDTGMSRAAVARAVKLLLEKGYFFHKRGGGTHRSRYPDDRRGKANIYSAVFRDQPEAAKPSQRTPVNRLIDDDEQSHSRDPKQHQGRNQKSKKNTITDTDPAETSNPGAQVPPSETSILEEPTADQHSTLPPELADRPAKVVAGAIAPQPQNENCDSPSQLWATTMANIEAMCHQIAAQSGAPRRSR